MSEKEVMDEYDKWDPMGDHFHYGKFCEGGMGSVITGDLEKEIPEKDILCRNPYEPGGKCYKQDCRKSHPINKNKSFDMHTGEKIQLESIAYHYQFDDLHPAQNLTTCPVKIQEINCPYAFFCNPLKSDMLSCTCDCSVEEEEEKESEFDLESEVRKRLKKEILKCPRERVERHRTNFVTGQVVAIKRRELGRQEYFLRGIMQEDLILESDEKISEAKAMVYFCDTGKVENVSILDILYLGRHWTNVNPVAYRCSLAGISPKGAVWSPRETDYFRSLVKDKNVIMRVVSTVFPPNDGFFPRKPYDVHLFVRDEESKNYQSVAKIMEENYQGIGHPETPFDFNV